MIADAFGWKLSLTENHPLNSTGESIHWYTYSALEFRRTLDLRDRRVFEYGCGSSSIFLASRIKGIFAAENYPSWAAEVGKANIPNLTILTAPEKETYVTVPHTVGGKFDIVIIDGRHRKECAAVALDLVQEDDFIIFDNADWYLAVSEALRSHGCPS